MYYKKEKLNFFNYSYKLILTLFKLTFKSYQLLKWHLKDTKLSLILIAHR